MILHDICHGRDGKGRNVPRYVMTNIGFFQIIDLEATHEGGDRKQSITMAGEKQLRRNDHIDRRQLPLSLLIDSGIQKVIVWDDRPADLKNGFSFQVLLAGKLMLGALLIRYEAGPA